MVTTAAFVDTNIFYEHVNLDQIKWLDVLKAERVVIVLAPVTFRELNDHKDSGRKPQLTARAASTLLNIDRFFEAAPDANPVPVYAGVELYGETRDPLVTPPLNPVIADDQLLANVLLYQTEHPDERVVLVTNDRGLRQPAGPV